MTASPTGERAEAATDAGTRAFVDAPFARAMDAAFGWLSAGAAPRDFNRKV